MKNFSQAFKDQAVKLPEDVEVKKAAEQLGVSHNTFACCHACVLVAGEEKDV